MRKETKAVGIVLALALFLSVTSTGVAQAQASPIRDLPESVEAGADFTVMVTWTSLADDFNAIGLTDNANATASMAVSGNTGWCSPNASNLNPVNNTMEYMWFGPYSNGTTFRAVYSVHVPTGASEGNYTFSGNLLYYIGSAGPYNEDIAGDSVIRVVKTPTSPTPTVTPTPVRKGGRAQEPREPRDTNGDSYSDVDETPNEYPDVVAVTPSASPTPTPTPTPTVTPTPSPSPTPGFEVIFAITGLLAVVYLILRRKK